MELEYNSPPFLLSLDILKDDLRIYRMYQGMGRLVKRELSNGGEEPMKKILRKNIDSLMN